MNSKLPEVKFVFELFLFFHISFIFTQPLGNLISNFRCNFYQCQSLFPYIVAGNHEYMELKTGRINSVQSSQKTYPS